MSHINDLFFDAGLSGFVAIGKLEYTATTLTTESLTLSRAETMAVNSIRITAGTMDSYGSHENTSNIGRISQNPTIQRHYPIFYMVRDTDILIARILHQQMNHKSHLR